MGFPGKNTGVGCHFLLQGVFLTQFLNLGLLYRRSPALQVDFLLTEPPAKPDKWIKSIFLFSNPHNVCVCVLSHFSHVWLFVTPWTIHGILQARILERVTMPSYRRSSQPRDWSPVSYGFCIGRRVLYYQSNLESPGSGGTFIQIILLPHPRQHSREKISQPLSVPFLPKGALHTLPVYWSTRWEHRPRKHRFREKESSACPLAITLHSKVSFVPHSCGVFW